MTAFRAIVTRHTLREALLGSFRASTINGVELNAASLAGRALKLHEDAEAALQSLTTLQAECRVGRGGARLSEYEWSLVGAKTYVRRVAAEERRQPSEAAVRHRPSISDEDFEQ